MCTRDREHDLEFDGYPAIERPSASISEASIIETNVKRAIRYRQISRDSSDKTQGLARIFEPKHGSKSNISGSRAFPLRIPGHPGAWRKARPPADPNGQASIIYLHVYLRSCLSPTTDN
jgi:hypothetical protein